MVYELEAKNRFFEANRTIAEHELRPGPTVTFISQVDLTAVEQIRTASGRQKPSYTAFVIKALAFAIKEFPYANRRVCRRVWWLPAFGKCLQAFKNCDVAVAAERDMPNIEYFAFLDVLRNADRLSLDQINDWLRSLATCNESNNTQWRQFSTIVRRLPRSLSALLIRMPVWVPTLWIKYRGGAAMVTSPAKYGVDTIIATWAWPLGVSFGYVKHRPLVKEGNIVACPTFDLILNFDRRVMLGAQAARFFNRLVDILENANHTMADALPSSIHSQACDAAYSQRWASHTTDHS